MNRFSSLRQTACGAIGIAVALVFLLEPVLAPAQIFGRRRSGQESEAENVFLPPDRSILQHLARAREAIAQEKYAEAVLHLGAILDSPEDFFFRPDRSAKTTAFRSLKGEAERLIGEMPPKGIEMYQLRFGAPAKRLLEEAILSGDADDLAEVSRRFFHTRAGYEATFLLGMQQLNHGRPLAAALTLQRLRETGREAGQFEPTLSLAAATAWLQAGMEDKARAALAPLKDWPAARPMQIGGKQELVFARERDPVKWLTAAIGPQRPAGMEELDRWVMFRGSPGRNAATAGGTPLLNLRWQVPIEEPTIHGMLQQLRQITAEQEIPMLAGLHPLAVDDRVLLRTARNLVAVDFETGKRLWEVPVDDPLDTTLGKVSPDALFKQDPGMALGLGQRVWGDATFGTLSSDGRLVFSIEDLGLGQQGQRRRAVIIGPRMVQEPGYSSYNRLAAHDIRSGKLVWHIGGPADQFPLPYAETFFLGPPLPLMGQLYVLAENKSEGAIVLMALDARKGTMLWSQSLAVVESTLQEDPTRRMAGVSPSYADGVLVCPTAVGAVVAVDMATRSLLWGYHYPRFGAYNNDGVVMVPFQVNQGDNQAPMRWSDSTATIVDGKVLVTPADSSALHCLDLLTGKEEWKVERKDAAKDDLYLAGVHKGKALLVGRKGMRAVSLADGKPAWNGVTAAFADGGTPSGRGFLSDDNYYVPLSNATVAVVELGEGKIAQVVPSRKGETPGNLICYRGRVISQGLEGVSLFYQLEAARQEVARRLAAKADDPSALGLRGEIRLDEGKRDEAIADLRRAYESDHDPRTRDLLREALFEGLRTDFAAYRDRTAEIEGLLDEVPQRATYLRLMAAGLQAAGQWRPAFEQYMALTALDPSGRRLESITPRWSVRRDRWVQAQVAGLLSDVPDAAARTEIDRAIQGRLDAAMQSGQVGPLREFLEYFGDRPAAQTARRELARRLAAADRVLESEIVLWKDVRSPDAAIAAPAALLLAETMRKVGRDRDAAACYARLRREFAAVDCGGGTTGQKAVEALPGDGPIRRAMDEKHDWPAGLVEVAMAKSKGSRQPTYGRMPVEFDGPTDPFFDELTVQYDQNQRVLAARDGLGAEAWRVPLAENQNQHVYFHRQMADAAALGHLMLVSLGGRVVAVDAAGNASNKAAKLLWDQNLMNVGLDLAIAQQMPGIFNGGIGWQPWAHARQNHRMTGVGPITSQLVGMLRFRTLTALDPMSGDVLWTQGQVPLGSELFGDDQYVFALPPDKETALVFRALDGKPLGERKVPRFAPGGPNEHFYDGRGMMKFVPFGVACIASYGRQVLFWHREGGQRAMQLYDPWEQKAIWGPIKFHTLAQMDMVGDRAVGICEPDGHFTLLGLPDGKPLMDVKLSLDSASGQLQKITLLPHGDRYLLLTHYPPKPNSSAQNRQIQPLPGMMMQPIFRGQAMALDAAGKPAWPAPVSLDYQYLAPDQPAHCPLLVFASQEYIQTGNMHRNYLRIKCLDKRNGRTVFESDAKDNRIENSTGTFEIGLDPQQKKVELRLQQQNIVLTLTDKPLPPEEKKPEEPKKEEKKKAPEGPAKAIFRALEKALERGPFQNGLPIEIDPFQ